METGERTTLITHTPRLWVENVRLQLGRRLERVLYLAGRLELVLLARALIKYIRNQLAGLDVSLLNWTLVEEKILTKRVMLALPRDILFESFIRSLAGPSKVALLDDTVDKMEVQFRDAATVYGNVGKDTVVTLEREQSTSTFAAPSALLRGAIGVTIGHMTPQRLKNSVRAIMAKIDAM